MVDTPHAVIEVERKQGFIIALMELNKVVCVDKVAVKAYLVRLVNLHHQFCISRG